MLGKELIKKSKAEAPKTLITNTFTSYNNDGWSGYNNILNTGGQSGGYIYIQSLGDYAYTTTSKTVNLAPGLITFYLYLFNSGTDQEFYFALNSTPVSIITPATSWIQYTYNNTSYTGPTTLSFNVTDAYGTHKIGIDTITYYVYA